MPSKLNEFLTDVKAKGFSKQNMFEFTLVPPSPLDKLLGSKIQLYCSAANTPGYNFLSEEEYVEVSDRRKYVYDYSKTDLNLTFYVDADSKVQELFNQWKKLVFVNGRKINYYDNYVGQGTLDILNVAPSTEGESKVAYSYRYIDLFPSNIGQLNYDWTTTGIQTLQVSFHYKEVKLKKAGEEEVSEGDNQDTSSSGGFLGTGLKVPGSTNANKFFNNVGLTGDNVQTVLSDPLKVFQDNSVAGLGEAMSAATEFAASPTLENVRDIATGLSTSVENTKGMVAGSIEAINGTIAGALSTYNGIVDSVVASYNEATEALDLVNIGTVLSETSELLGEGTLVVNDLLTFFPNSTKLQKLSEGLGKITTATSGASEASTQAGTTQPQNSKNTTVNKTIPNVKDAIKAFKKFL